MLRDSPTPLPIYSGDHYQPFRTEADEACARELPVKDSDTAKLVRTAMRLTSGNEGFLPGSSPVGSVGAVHMHYGFTEIVEPSPGALS